MALPIKLELPEGFLKEEIRCGYRVSTKLKKIWAVELDLVSELDRVCRKYGLRYVASYGTLIGAIRHKGFIPWDDDLDVWMPRKDYDALAKVAPTEFKYPYFLQTAMSDRRHFSGAYRLRNSATTAIVKGQGTADFNNGVFIDFLPLDEVSCNATWDIVRKKMMQFAIRGASLHGETSIGNSRFKRMISPLLRPLACAVPYPWWVALYDFSLRSMGHDRELLAPIFSIGKNERAIRVFDEDINCAIRQPYEFIDIPVPRGYDAMLREYYGDYMSFPPESERGAWHEGQIVFDPETPYIEYIKRQYDK